MTAQFMIDLEGTELSEEEYLILQNPNVGAVLLFTRNFANTTQLKKLTSTIHAINPQIFIAVDQEGGNVQRFQRYGFHSIPCAQSYGTVYDMDQPTGLRFAEHYGQIMAADLLKCGVDLSLAPILDVHGQSTIIGGLNRAFHQHPDAVIKLGHAFIKGMNAAGMPAVGKHFPGHGSIISDSHIDKPQTHATKAEIEGYDLKPFAELIRKNVLQAIMPAHVTYLAVDKDNPAGFSKIWLQDILRNELQFTGLIISDCLSMKGADVGNLITRAEKALTAGCDMLIVSHQPRPILRELLDAISGASCTQSTTRIQTFKQQMRRFTVNASACLSPEDIALDDKKTQPDSAFEQLNKTNTI